MGNRLIHLGAKVKLQKQLSRKVNEKRYPKYVITIPPKHVEKLGWKEGEELNGTISNNRPRIINLSSLIFNHTTHLWYIQFPSCLPI